MYIYSITTTYFTNATTVAIPLLFAEIFGGLVDIVAKLEGLKLVNTSVTAKVEVLGDTSVSSSTIS